MDKLDFIDRELAHIKSKYSEIEGLELISCVRVLVQLKYTKTANKQLTCCFQFPDDYPCSGAVMELKSKTLAARLLDGLTKVCEDEEKKLVGQEQVLAMMKFIKRFIEENPLCVCSEELAHIRSEMLRSGDEMKLKQKSSQVMLKLQQNQYHLSVRLTVPDNYPIARLGIEITDHNFPMLLRTHFEAAAEELARQCVEAPLKKNPKAPAFVAKPALRPIVEYLITDCVRKYPPEMCPVCGKQALPTNPQEAITDERHDQFVERVYCSHLYHRSCLDHYMKQPPFTGGKKCPTCNQRIFHEKWKVPPRLQEARWAHKEARRRELAEVVDFLE